MTTETKVTLETIGGKAAGELFDAELSRVLQNIADPNTDAKAKRVITLTFTFKPGKERTAAKVETKCKATLAGINTVESDVFIGMSKGQLIAVEGTDPRQGKLFDKNNPQGPQLAVAAGNVAPFPGGAVGAAPHSQTVSQQE